MKRALCFILTLVKLNYEGNSLKGGIYKIVNCHNGRIYIGSAARFKTRWQHGHARSLEAGKHKNKFLQADFNKCKEELGHDDFLEFHVIQLMENATKEERKIAEQEWIDRYFDGGNQCYNLQRKAVLSREDVPSKNPFVTFDKKSKAAKGKKHSPEWNARISESHKGKKLSAAHKEKIGVASKGRGKGIKRAPEIGRKIAEAKIGKPHPMPEAVRLKLCKTYQTNLISPDGVLYTEIVGLADFARTHGLSVAGLRFVITGKRASHKGWKLTGTLQGQLPS